ncbi:aldehyde dehydrogenase [Marinomonas fungiae]|uniref:Acyl-CoA reductase or other NAD-dependent aldehyde dehydrogenase n=1 Tax=Marinomonas fungiae TaxID=1137284 RepID=A0A0K6ILY8_9GAMM|nr:aldehyde dehydrogenase [Marinomonas fungiae]CUB04125.1 Acyl-CoA reductase or other NAD-dependent aldehyde dehydrogenase [Marinomonas fungiae]
MDQSATSAQLGSAVVELFIDGELRAARDQQYFERLNPATQSVSSQVADGRACDAQQMLFAATRCFATWSKMELDDRIQIFHRAKDLLPSYKKRFSLAMQEDIGAAQDWIDFNLNVAMDVIDAAIDLARRCQHDSDEADSQNSFLIRQPAGVCLAIAPWNAPIALGMRAVIFPLIFGNTVVFKASDMSPQTHLLIALLLKEAGLPAGALNVINNRPEHSEAVLRCLISNPAVRRINFTGSTRVGRIVAGMAAEHVKRCLLELGGKSPVIVLKDADLELATNAVIHGAFLNQGQICMATDRIIVEQAIAEEFISRLVQRAKSITAQPPSQKGCQLGPVASPSIANRLSGLIEDALDKGARLLTGARVQGQFIDATLIDRITPMMRLYSEECFGPIAGIYRVENVEEAITLANDCEYGLAAAIFSQDLDKATYIAERLESGTCHINSSTVQDDPSKPFGGLKSSGYGRFGGLACIDEFTELRWITVQ